MDDIISLIKSSDEYTVGALLSLYNCQTIDEQQSGYTCHQNNRGFNAFDSTILSNIAEFYLSKGFLTSKQINFVRMKLKKYAKQLQSLDIQPATINKNNTEKPSKPQKKYQQWAGMMDNGKKIQIKFMYPYGDKRFKETVKKVKEELEGRQFIQEKKIWVMPALIENADKLKEWGFEFSDTLKEWYQKMTDKLSRGVTPITDIKGLGVKLRPFQAEGVGFIDRNNGRALIGDEPGVGKTYQALSWILHRHATPAIIVVPASLKINWERECAKACPEFKCKVLSGRNLYDLTNADIADIYIVNYDILPNITKKVDDNLNPGKTKSIEIPNTGWASELVKIHAKTLVVDECHFIKNSKAMRTKAVKKLAKTVKHVIPLSGTPIVNRPIEFFNSLNLVDPVRFSSFWRYAKKYCGATHNGFGWDLSGASNIEELNKKIQPIMLRRLKKDVLTDLPDKIHSVIPLEISNRHEYDEAANNFISWVKENFGEEKADKAQNAEVLSSIEALKQLAVEGKINEVLAWIENFLESGQKLVIFGTHHKTIDFLIEKLTPKFGTVKLDGRDSPPAKQSAIDAFQNDPTIQVFIGNTKAAGVGITLTAASNVAFVELPWTPGDLDQAADRCHRIGQKNAVNIWYLVAHNTVEEEIVNILDQKRAVLDAVLDGKQTESTSLLSELLRNLFEKE